MEELYRVFSRGVRFFLWRQLGKQDLDDTVHDTFLTVAEAIRRGDVREPDRLMGFVWTVVRRQLAAHIERTVHRETNVWNSMARRACWISAADPEWKAIAGSIRVLARRLLREVSGTGPGGIGPILFERAKTGRDLPRHGSDPDPIPPPEVARKGAPGDAGQKEAIPTQNLLVSVLLPCCNTSGRLIRTSVQLWLVLEEEQARHPDDEQVEQYSLGSVGRGGNSSAFEQHLLICPACQDRVAEMDLNIQGVQAAARETSRRDAAPR